MAMKRASAIVLILVATQSFAAPALAETIELPPHTHRREFLHHKTQEVLKDFEWTTTLVLDVRDSGVTWVEMTNRCVIHVDKPHDDKYREKDLQYKKNGINRFDVHLSNGMVWHVPRSTGKIGPNAWRTHYGVQGHQIIKIVAYGASFRGWSHTWWIREPTVSWERAISQASSAVNDAAERPRAAQLELMGQIVGLLAPHGEADHDVAIGASVIDLERDRQELLDDRLEDYLERIRDAVDETERARAWRELRQEMLERSTHFMRNLASSEIEVEDARRLLQVVKYGSQAVDDLKDLSPKGGATSEYTRFLNYAHGVAALAEGVENEDARVIMAGLRDTVGTMEKSVGALGVSVPSSTAAILDMPGEVVASMIDVSREGLDQATETMEHIAAGLDGDEAALRRAVESSRRIEEILASENYGRAMESALTDRVIDKIPFLRTIVAWFK